MGQRLSQPLTSSSENQLWFMSAIGNPERATQNRVIALFREDLSYRCLGDRSDSLCPKRHRWCERDGAVKLLKERSMYARF